MKYFIFRNMTIERFFSGFDVSFSGYEDISSIPDADRYVWFYMAPFHGSNETVVREVRNYLDLLRLTLPRLDSKKMLIIVTMRQVYEISTVTSDLSVENAIYEYNTSLQEIADTHQNVKIVDFSSFLNRYPSKDLLDWKYYFISQMALNPRLSGDFQAWFYNQIQAIELIRKKCLILDMDNTLWGGVLGEEGIEGIKLGGDYPGKAFLMFQHQIEELGREGVILAACSKNNLSDVKELWEKHPDCVLKENHFSIVKINWNNKADNIREIASDLNIGLDSIVFFDDNPAERELVKTTIPEVTVPDFPSQPYELPVFLKSVAEQYFAVYSLTKEDLAKTEQYKANALRTSSKSQFTNMAEYIRSLEIELDISEVTPISLPRVAQMTQKTNQFNLTSKRYSDADIRKLLEEGAKVYTLSVKDKFGDSGITGACIVKIMESAAEIDSLLLSCRILGKDIEKAFITHVLGLLQSCGVGSVRACYFPTAKNSQVESFYEANHFTIDYVENGNKYYLMDIPSLKLANNTNYKYSR